MPNSKPETFGHPPSQEKVLVVGAGTMGRQIALQCALSGLPVMLQDRSEQVVGDAAAFVRAYLVERVRRGKLDEAKVLAVEARLELTSSLELAARGATIVIEAIIEKFEAKADLFRRLEAVCPPSTLLTSNSSNIRPSRLAAVVQHPHRVVNLHFFYPALVMELVEVVAHPGASEDAVVRAIAFCKAIGRVPVLLRKEIPGFIVNRIFRALTREAISLVEDGIATAADVDLAVTKGLGHPMGPLRLIDMTGIDVAYMARLDEFQETGMSTAKPNELLKKKFEDGEWGKKTGKGFYEYPEAHP